MGTLALSSFIVVGCASAPPPPAAPVETTGASLPREAFTPPDQWEMQIADKPASDIDKDAPATKVAPRTTADKRQKGGLVTMPGHSQPSGN